LDILALGVNVASTNSGKAKAAYKGSVPEAPADNASTTYSYHPISLTYLSGTSLIMASHTLVVEQVAHLDLIRHKMLAVANKISDTWSDVVASPNQIGLQELRLLLAGQDGLLSDLQDEERVTAENTTIHVKSVSCP
jgi:hypothetical protein